MRSAGGRQLVGLGDQLGVLGRVGHLDQIVGPAAVALGQPAAGGGRHLDVTARARLDPFEDADRAVGLAAVAALAGDVGVGSDDRDRLQARGIQRQERALVAQQDDRLLGGVARQRAIGGALRLGDRRQRVGLVEDPELHLGAQQARDRLIDLGRRHALGGGRVPGLHLVEQRRVAFAFGHLQVDARVQRLAPGGAQIGDDVVLALELGDAEVVRHDEAAEAPLAAQDAAQQPAVGVRGDAVDLVVARHDAGDRRLAHHRLDRREEDLAQHVHRVVAGRGVASPLGRAVRGEVLGGRRDVRGVDRRVGAAASLKAAHRRDAHAADQIGVLAVGLFDAPPARVARDVDHRRQHVLHAARARLARGDGEDLLDQVGIEGRRQRDRLREAGGRRDREPVQRLFVHQRRNAEAGLLDQVLLDRVREHRGAGRVGVAIARSGDLADAVAQQLLGRLERQRVGLRRRRGGCAPS